MEETKVAKIILTVKQTVGMFLAAGTVRLVQVGGKMNAAMHRDIFDDKQFQSAQSQDNIGVAWT